MLENSQEGWHPFARDEPSREYVPHACRAQPEPYRWSGMPRRSTLRATPTPPPLGPGRQPATPGTAPAAAVGRLTRDAGIDPLRAPVMLDARLPARGMHEALASILVGAAVLVMAWGQISTRPLPGARQAHVPRGHSREARQSAAMGRWVSISVET